MYYNNLLQGKSKEDKTEVYSFELLLQLCRHFYDGNVFTASVNMGRIPTALEEKYSIFKRVLGQRTQYNSFIIAPLISFFYNNLFYKDIKAKKRTKFAVGIRKWTYQTFENIEHENYYFDLSSNKESQKEQYYANLITCYAYNNALDFDYNDRFMRFLYERVAVADPKQFNSLDFDFATLSDTGFNKIADYFDKHT